MYNDSFADRNNSVDSEIRSGVASWSDKLLHTDKLWLLKLLLSVCLFVIPCQNSSLYNVGNCVKIRIIYFRNLISMLETQGYNEMGYSFTSVKLYRIPL